VIRGKQEKELQGGRRTGLLEEDRRQHRKVVAKRKEHEPESCAAEETIPSSDKTPIELSPACDEDDNRAPPFSGCASGQLDSTRGGIRARSGQTTAPHIRLAPEISRLATLREGDRIYQMVGGICHSRTTPGSHPRHALFTTRTGVRVHPHLRQFTGPGRPVMDHHEHVASIRARNLLEASKLLLKRWKLCSSKNVGTRARPPYLPWAMQVLGRPIPAW